MYNSPANYNHKARNCFEHPSGKSMTVPDQNYTIREIMNKFTTGQPISGMGSYNDFDADDVSLDDEHLPDPASMDLHDRYELKERLESERKTLSEKYKKKPKPVAVPVASADDLPPTPEGKKD